MSYKFRVFCRLYFIQGDGRIVRIVLFVFLSWWLCLLSRDATPFSLQFVPYVRWREESFSLSPLISVLRHTRRFCIITASLWASHAAPHAVWKLLKTCGAHPVKMGFSSRWKISCCLRMMKWNNICIFLSTEVISASNDDTKENVVLSWISSRREIPPQVSIELVIECVCVVISLISWSFCTGLV